MDASEGKGGSRRIRVPEGVRQEGVRGAVEGSRQTRTWTGREDVKRYTTEVLASRVQVLTKLQEAPPVAPPEGEEPPKRDDDILFQSLVSGGP